MEGNIFNIQRFSLDDGPGIRTVVFLKGCNQRCVWCHNPESLEMKPQLFRNYSSCTACGYCIKYCGQEAIFRAEDGSIRIDDGKCIGCGECVKHCPQDVLKIMGYTLDSEELFRIIKKDIPYYKRTGGGVTFSGGEPTFQKEFLIEALSMCRNEGIHTAIETNGNTDIEDIKILSELLDYVMIDLKHVDDKKHREYTYSDNKRNLEAIKYYTEHNITEVRIPVIPDFNDSAEEIQGMLDYLDRETKAKKVVLLPYHTYGLSKYRNLCMQSEYSKYEDPIDRKVLTELVESSDTGNLQVSVR